MSRQRTLDVVERRARVVALRRDRWTWDAIGNDLGVSRQRAREIYDDALSEVTIAEVEEHRHEEGELIDRGVRQLLSIAEDPDVSPRTRVEAWSSIRGWSEWRGKLFGLPAPTQVHVTTTADSDFDRAYAELTEAMQDRDVSAER